MSGFTERLREMFPAERKKAPLWAPALAVFVLALAARLAYWVQKETRLGTDSSGYLATCDLWASAPLEAIQHSIGIEYAGFTLPMCSVLGLTGSPDAWIVVQILFSAVAAVLIFDTARRALGRRAGLVAGIGMALLWEMFQWDIYLLSDTTFIVVLSFVLWSTTRFYLEASRKNRAMALAGLGLLAITRPFGAPIAIGYLAVDLWRGWSTDSPQLVQNRWVGAALIVALVVLPTIVSARTGWAESMLLDTWMQGRIVHDDPTFDYPFALSHASSPLDFVLANPGDMLVMGVLKVGAFFVPFVPRFSLVHIGINAATLLPLMLAGTAGLVVLANRDGDLAASWSVPLLIVLAIVAATFVDWDWRYRAPAGPVFALFTAAFAQEVLTRQAEAGSVSVSDHQTRSS